VRAILEICNISEDMTEKPSQNINY